MPSFAPQTLVSRDPYPIPPSLPCLPLTFLPFPAPPAPKPRSYLYAKNTGTKRCSLCYAETKNAGVAAFKVRLCPLCTATGVLNKSAAAAAYSLSSAELSKLPQWTEVQPAFIGYDDAVVTMFLVRDLERAAHRKYGGRAGFEAHRAARDDKQEARAAAKATSEAEVRKELKVGRGALLLGAGGPRIHPGSAAEAAKDLKARKYEGRGPFH